MIEKTEAIILNRANYGETSLIVTFYTKKFGKLKGILKGARSDDKKYSSSFENFSLNHIVFYLKSTTNLNLITGCELIDSFPQIRRNLEKIKLAIYFINLLDKATQLNDPNPDIFNLCINNLKFLQGYKNLDKLVRIFEIKLLVLSGLMPHINSCSYCEKYVEEDNFYFSYKFGGLICKNCIKNEPNYFKMLKGTVSSMRFIIKSDLKTAVRIEFSSEVKKELEKLLRNFLSYHLDISPYLFYVKDYVTIS